MRIYLIILALTLFLVQGIHASRTGVSLKATGYEWLGYSSEEKRVFAGLLHLAVDKKKGAYKTDEIIKKLDSFYYSAMEKARSDPLKFDEDEYLRIPCVKVIEQ